MGGRGGGRAFCRARAFLEIAIPQFRGGTCLACFLPRRLRNYLEEGSVSQETEIRKISDFPRESSGRRATKRSLRYYYGRRGGAYEISSEVIVVFQPFKANVRSKHRKVETK